MNKIKIIVTAGPTRELIDPVRFISNRSTGEMGYAIAAEASHRKHTVTLISGPTRIKSPKVKRFIPIETAEDLLKALKKEIKSADCLIMCAAVGDFSVRRVASKKIKRKKALSLQLVPNKDILRELSMYKKAKLFVGFSLETENWLKNSSKKLKSKKLDLIVANRLTKRYNPFGDNKLDICIIDKSGHRIYIDNRKKPFISHVLLDKIEQMWYLESDK
ncbi:MAG: phosphopantothenoylcysteine decarboxylase [Candidatus Omnitrophica bacterium]|nr:phosphopantothenoylcysteine decarboxylase [Candidatus Omnitrophota bacterium]